MSRDPERTRRRILAAAEKEFSAKGFAGARVDAIARRAGVNKRMLYHYFGNKQRLFREVVRQMMTAEGSPFRAAREAPPQVAEHMLRWNEALRREPNYIRLLQWEALETAGRRVIGEAERLEEEVESVERVRMLQREGGLPSDLDPAQLLLTLIGMVAFPLAFPQLARLVTGLGPGDPAFQERRARFLRDVSRYLEGSPALAEPQPDTCGHEEGCNAPMSTD